MLFIYKNAIYHQQSSPESLDNDHFRPKSALKHIIQLGKWYSDVEGSIKWVLSNQLSDSHIRIIEKFTLYMIRNDLRKEPGYEDIDKINHR